MILWLRLPGKTVEQGLDVLDVAGSRNSAVIREYVDVEVKDKLTIELLPSTPNPAWQQMPVLQAFDVERQE